MSLDNTLEVRTFSIGKAPAGLSVFENVESTTDLALIRTEQILTGSIARIASGSQYRFDSSLVSGGVAGLGGGRWIPVSEISAKDFGAVGDGITDDTNAINNAIQAMSSGAVILPRGEFLITDSIIAKSNVDIIGENSTIKVVTPSEAIVMLKGTSVSSVNISGIKFVSTGNWTATPFANPDGEGNSVGFTNNHWGIQFLSSSNNITVKNCSFTGIARGVVLTGCQNFDVSNNLFSTLGISGVYIYTSYFGVVSNNVIRGVLGNMTDPDDISTANSKFADGVFIYSSTDLTVSVNVIENVKRIGVVLEGDGVNKNSKINISCNVITNCNTSKGTEHNAGIWSELTMSDYSCSAMNNVLNNTGAVLGNQISYGIMANYLTCTGNIARGWQIGIGGIEMRVFSNTIEANDVGVFVATQGNNVTTPLTLTSDISNNRIAKNNEAGIHVYHSRGNINVLSNTIEDNGQNTSIRARKSGLLIEEYYNNQKVVVDGNVFISSTSANAAQTTGQTAGIMGVAGGDVTRTWNYVSHNQFVFTASPVPNIAQYPVSYAYDDTAVTYINEVYPGNDAGNINGKFVQSANGGPLRTSAGSPSGVLTPRYVGEFVIDTTNNKMYFANGGTDTNWVILN